MAGTCAVVTVAMKFGGAVELEFLNGADHSWTPLFLRLAYLLVKKLLFNRIFLTYLLARRIHRVLWSKPFQIKSRIDAMRLRRMWILYLFRVAWCCDYILAETRWIFSAIGLFRVVSHLLFQRIHLRMGQMLLSRLEIQLLWKRYTRIQENWLLCLQQAFSIAWIRFTAVNFVFDNGIK